jgi:integrase
MRKQGEGSVFKRKNKEGKVTGYTAILDLGRVNGKRNRRKFQGKTLAEVRDKLRAAQHQNDNGVLPTAGKRSVAQWMEEWLRDVAKVRPSTHRSYKGFVEQHIIPVLGRIPLEKLTVGEVRGLLNSRNGLSPRSVNHLRAVLRRALNVAIKEGLIPSQRNVAALADASPVPWSEMKAYEAEQAQAFLESAQGDPLEAVYVVALTTGMRQGEILGLRWRSVDLEAGTMRVDYALQRVGKVYQLVEPKTKKSRRLIHLTALAVNALKAHKDTQQEAAQQPGAIRNLEWHDLVFRTATGKPLNGTWVNHRFQASARAAGLPPIRFHNLRHSCAALLIALKVDVVVVSKLLGHSTVTQTLNTYSHAFAKAERDAANAMDTALNAARR